MKFNKDLYGVIKCAMPEMTVRQFSRYCGRSEGYYGSITAQALPLSTNALLHLAEMLTHRQKLDQTQALNSALAMIAQEVANRMQNINTRNWAVRQMIIKAVAKTQCSSANLGLAPMPIVVW